MAKGRKTGGRNWKPGECGNQKGRPPKDHEARIVFYEAAPDVARRMVARALNTEGEPDFQAERYVLDQVLGKATEKHEVSGSVNVVPVFELTIKKGE